MRIRSALAIVAAAGLAACASKSDLEAAQARLAETQAKMEEFRLTAETLKKENQELRTALVEASASVKNGQAAIAALRTEAAREQPQLVQKPMLPITYEFRSSPTGPGMVAMLSSMVKDALPVLVTVKGTDAGPAKRTEVVVQPTGTTELGQRQGVQLQPGDTVQLTSPGFEPASFEVPGR